MYLVISFTLSCTISLHLDTFAYVFRMMLDALGPMFPHFLMQMCLIELQSRRTCRIENASATPFHPSRPRWWPGRCPTSKSKELPVPSHSTSPTWKPLKKPPKIGDLCSESRHCSNPIDVKLHQITSNYSIHLQIMKTHVRNTSCFMSHFVWLCRTALLDFPLGDPGTTPGPPRDHPGTS